jgi:hypothetical protein
MLLQRALKAAPTRGGWGVRTASPAPVGEAAQPSRVLLSRGIPQVHTLKPYHAIAPLRFAFADRTSDGWPAISRIFRFMRAKFSITGKTSASRSLGRAGSCGEVCRYQSAPIPKFGIGPLDIQEHALLQSHEAGSVERGKLPQSRQNRSASLTANSGCDRQSLPIVPWITS